MILMFVAGWSTTRSERCSGAWFTRDTLSMRLSPGRGNDGLAAEVDRGPWKRLLWLLMAPASSLDSFSYAWST